MFLQVKRNLGNQAGFCDLCHTVDDSAGQYTQESFALDHPYLICAESNATCCFGVVRNCCGGETLMPEVYSRTLATVNDSS